MTFRRGDLLLLLLLAVPLAPAHGADRLPYSEPARSGFLQTGLQAMRQISAPGLERIKTAIAGAVRNECKSLQDVPILKCLQKFAHALCEPVTGADRSVCLPVADLVIVNKMNEESFISKEERFRISQNSARYAEDYAAALGAKYALLASQVMLQAKVKCPDSGPGCLVRDIDRYCKVTSDKKSLPWQACAGALVWYVGGR
jgi:hypothetical protein